MDTTTSRLKKKGTIPLYQHLLQKLASLMVWGFNNLQIWKDLISAKNCVHVFEYVLQFKECLF